MFRGRLAVCRPSAAPGLGQDDRPGKGDFPWLRAIWLGNKGGGLGVLAVCLAGVVVSQGWPSWLGAAAPLAAERKPARREPDRRSRSSRRRELREAA